MNYLIILFFLCNTIFGFAQQDDFVPFDPPLENKVYANTIRSIEIRARNILASDAVLDLNSNTQLIIAFDDLNLTQKNYHFTFVHCDAHWQTDRLLPNDYLKGYTDDLFRTIKYSINTTKAYIHYEAYFPNENISLTKSGNYLLKVYEDYDINKLAFTYRVIVFDNKFSINAKVVRTGIVQNRNTHQQVNFDISFNKIAISNPMADIKVAVLKNSDWNNALSNISPTFIDINGLHYSTVADNTIAAGNEFREFDTRDLRIVTNYINAIQFDTNTYNVFLITEPTKQKRYSFKGDINGRYSILNRNGIDATTDADYTYVHFKLPYESPISQGDVYLYGQLSNYSFAPLNKLHYNQATLTYEAVMQLKQGFYNYEYVFKPYNYTGSIDELKRLDGDFFETENTYTILVYAQTQGIFYDQLLGYTTIQSIN